MHNNNDNEVLPLMLERTKQLYHYPLLSLINIRVLRVDHVDVPQHGVAGAVPE